MSDDPGQRIAYTALEQDTPVFDSEGVEVGKVEAVLAVEQVDVFDGVLIDVGVAKTRFIDADSVGALYEHRMELKLTAAEVEEQPEHEIGTDAEEPLLGKKGPMDFLRGRDYWRRDKGPGPG